MKNCLILLILLLPVMGLASTPRAATGLEAGVSRLSHDGKALIGTSWVYHFEYQPEPLFGFFGQAGQAHAEEGSTRYQETQFSGGLMVPLLENLGLNVGLSNTINEVKKDGDVDRKRKLGPLAGLFVHSEFGAFSIRTSATVIRTEELSSFALRMGLMLQF